MQKPIKKPPKNKITVFIQHITPKTHLVMACLTFFGATVGLWQAGLPPAWAACNPGAQCSVTDGSTENRTGEIFHTNNAGVNNAALHATNGSTINGSNLTITAAAGVDHYGVYLDSGGSLNLSNSTINAPYTALRLQGNASAVLNNVDITGGQSDLAVRLHNGGGSSLTMTGGSINSTGPLGAIMFGGTGGNTLTLNQVNIIAAGFHGVDGSLGFNNALTINGGTINYTGGQAAVRLSGTGVIDGTSIVSSAHGIMLNAPAGYISRLTARNFDIMTTGNPNYGVNINTRAQALLEDGKITTSGSDAKGIMVFQTNDATPLVAKRVTIQTAGGNAFGIEQHTGTSTLEDVVIEANATYGLVVTRAFTSPLSRIEMTGGSITSAAGAAAVNQGEILLKNVTVDASAVGAPGVFVSNQGKVWLDKTTVTAMNNGYGVRVQSGAQAEITNNSTITTDGATGVGLLFMGATAANTITVENSSVNAAQSYAVLANGGTDLLDVRSSSIKGEALVYAGDCLAANCGGTAYGSKLEIRAKDSQLQGHTYFSLLSNLDMNFLAGGNTWTLTPSTVLGMTDSYVSRLDLGGTNHIVFDPQGTGQWQSLTVDSLVGGDIYNNMPGADTHIYFNTYLNDGGLGNQFTDRLLIEGNVTGAPTIVHVTAAPGSPGGATSPSGAYLASEGISLIQVSGNATEGSFVLNGGYVTLGGQPWQYQLYAYGPGASNGAADTNQQLVGGNDHWDWRLQSQQAPNPQPPNPQNVDPPKPDPQRLDPPTPNPRRPALRVLSPQAASYLVAPRALFHVGMLDLGTLHRRLGDARRIADRTSTNAAGTLWRPQAFLRTYGGDYRYRSDLSAVQYGYSAKTRYTAIQGGGSVYGIDRTHSQLAFGLAASYGGASFEPLHVEGSSKTTMHNWSVSPTLTWQNTAGMYIDTIVSYGGLTGDVASQALGKTAKLKGTTRAVSLETGVSLSVGDWVVQPQLQAVYQHLKFDPMWSKDRGTGFPVVLGSLHQTTLRGGTEVQKAFHTAAASLIRAYGKVHIAHTLDTRQQVRLGSVQLVVGKMGTVLDAGLGLDVVFAAGKAAIYTEISRQQRLSHAGNQGWAFNLGGRIRF